MSESHVRAAIVAALEAAEVGDSRLLVEILLGALENGPIEFRCECPACGQRFEWPGLRAAHFCAARLREAA